MRAAVLLFALPALVAAEPYLPAPFNARLAQPVITAAPQPRGLLSRQDLGSIPECAIGCLSSLGGSCTFGDIACYCTDPAAIASLQGCLPTVCQGDDLTNAVNAAQSLCADSGVTTFDSSSASEAVASATESAGDAIESASASAAEAVSSIQGAASAEASSAAGAVASARSSAASAVGSLTSAAGGAISSARSQIGASASSLSSALVASASASTTGGALPARATGMGYLVGAAAVAGGMMVGL